MPCKKYRSAKKRAACRAEKARKARKASAKKASKRKR